MIVIRCVIDVVLVFGLVCVGFVNGVGLGMRVAVCGLRVVFLLL